MEYKFYLDGISSESVGIRMGVPIQFSSAEPNIEEITVPGRNGALHYWDGSYKNVKGSAVAYAYSGTDIASVLQSISSLFRIRNGYRRLEVPEEKGIYRLARLKAMPQAVIKGDRIAPFEIIFDCDPRRFLKSGEREVTISGSATLRNPTGFPVTPTINATGTGTVTVNGTQTSISDIVLGEGNTVITVTGYTSFKVKPGWYFV